LQFRQDYDLTIQEPLSDQGPLRTKKAMSRFPDRPETFSDEDFHPERMPATSRAPTLRMAN